ncbi:MAG: cobyric acid synthase CobQ, partial [Bacteroidia bacterium]|nr:cobyric acid synthase CobQ [Bacteroidia bacterium]
WFSPMIAEEHTNDDEDAYQQEAERRIELHRNNSADKDLPGNRIKIVGYDGNKDYSTLNHLRAIPGTVVSTFNNKQQTTFSVFIHAPFKEHLNSAEKDKNSTSIVFQARFKELAADKEFSGLAMFGGDSDHYSWAIILEKTKKYKNDVNEQALKWDLFLAPHHCSWTFFNDTPQDENTEPKKTSLEVLDNKRNGARVIASSKKIVNEDDNPPHYEAKQEYIKKLAKSSDFLNTSIEPKESAPEPLVFEITGSGIKKLKTASEAEADRLAAAISVASTGVIKKPWAW